MRRRRLLLILGLVGSISGVAAGPLGAQPSSAEKELVDKIRLRKSDPATALRFLEFGGAAIAIALAVYFGHRWLQRRTEIARSRSRGAERVLQGYGFDSRERELLGRIAASGGVDPVLLIRDREGFERTVAHSEGREGRQERVLDGVRRKLGWDASFAASPAVPKPIGLPARPATLDLNQEVELFGTEELAGFCARAVVVHRDEDNVVFRFLEGKEEIPFSGGDRLQVYFWRANDAGYLCYSRIKEVRSTGPGFLIMTPPEGIERQQKRIYVRVPYHESFRFLHIPLSSASELLGSEARAGGLWEGICEDLSAGGFRLATAADLKEGDYVSIPGFGPADGTEIMARVVSRLADAAGVRRFGVQYIGIPVATRDLINRRVFERQRQLILERLKGDRALAAEGSVSAAGDPGAGLGNE